MERAKNSNCQPSSSYRRSVRFKETREVRKRNHHHGIINRESDSPEPFLVRDPSPSFESVDFGKVGRSKKTKTGGGDELRNPESSFEAYCENAWKRLHDVPRRERAGMVAAAEARDRAEQDPWDVIAYDRRVKERREMISAGEYNKLKHKEEHEQRQRMTKSSEGLKAFSERQKVWLQELLEEEEEETRQEESRRRELEERRRRELSRQSDAAPVSLSLSSPRSWGRACKKMIRSKGKHDLRPPTVGASPDAPKARRLAKALRLGQPRRSKAGSDDPVGLAKPG